MLEDEEKHKPIRSALKSLPKVKAHSDFESKLYHRLRSIESERLSSPAFRKLEGARVSSGWLGMILRPALIPAAGLSIIVLIAVLLYIHNLSQINNTTGPITQSVTQNELDNKKQTVESQREQITKNEEVTPQKEETLRRELTERPSGPMLPESDFETTPAPVQPPGILESKTQPLEDQSMDKLAEPKEEKRAMEKESDETKRVEKKGAPENIRKDDESGHENDVLQKVAPSVIEGKMRSADTIKADSVKSKHLKKKDNKILNEQTDSIKAQEQQEQQTDSTKNK
jgi:hypothetical protein